MSHLQTPPPQTTYNARRLLELLHIPSFHDTDEQTVKIETAWMDPQEMRIHTQRMIGSEIYHSWCFEQTRPTLLLQGNLTTNTDTSQLSLILVCIKMCELRHRKDDVQLIFFCGLHLQGHAHAGPLAMIRSFIAQVLQLYVGCDSCGFRFPQVNLDEAGRGNITELCEVFAYLIQALPSHMTLVCHIDSIQLYDCDEYWRDTEYILRFISELFERYPPGKILATSPQPPAPRVSRMFNNALTVLAPTTSSRPRQDNQSSSLPGEARD